MTEKNTLWQENDPFYRREMEKYGANPLPSREFIMQCLEKEGKLMRPAEIAAAFGMDEERAILLEHRLKAMIRAGQLMVNRRGRIGLSRKMDLVGGQVIAHPEGYGFFRPEDGADDGFIPPKYMGGLMHDDKILARVAGVDRQGRKDYAPVEILARGQKRVVGKLQNVQGVWFVSPENRRLFRQILIPADKRLGAADGEIVVAEIIEYPTRFTQPVAVVVSILGAQRAPGMEVEIALENHHIPHVFPAEVLTESASLPDVLRAQDYEGRLDLRHLPFVTIDGLDARDFDDAVFAEKRGSNYRLYVAIADVSHYVGIGRPLDTEAQKRGTSVYFPDRVIPMLPEKLSTGLCSLNPGVDRLAMVCEMTITADGQVKRSKFHEAVIHSHARLTYETAEEILFSDSENNSVREEFIRILPALDALKDTYTILERARQARHTLNFDIPEAEFEYDSEGKIAGINARSRLNAHKLIEECMIVANITAAKFLHRHKIPALYRIHDTPSRERLAKLKAYGSRLGLQRFASLGERTTPEELAAMLASAAGRNDYRLIEKMILRSMEQAVYSPQNRGHFGLALDSYAHFTSPIRRYPDLLAHRGIRHILRGGTASNYIYDGGQMNEFAAQSSMAERRADEAAREAMDTLKCEFMSHRIGEEHHGEITGITAFGLFVTLDDYFIDGLVHISNLPDDYYHFDPDHVSLSGERSGLNFHMLDKVSIRVAKVDMDDRKIDFELVRGGSTTKKRRKDNSASSAAAKNRAAAKNAKTPRGKTTRKTRKK